MRVAAPPSNVRPQVCAGPTPCAHGLPGPPTMPRKAATGLSGAAPGMRMYQGPPQAPGRPPPAPRRSEALLPHLPPSRTHHRATPVPPSRPHHRTGHGHHSRHHNRHHHHRSHSSSGRLAACRAKLCGVIPAVGQEALGRTAPCGRRGKTCCSGVSWRRHGRCWRAAAATVVVMANTIPPLGGGTWQHTGGSVVCLL